MPPINDSAVVDFNHPLFLHPSDTPGTPLISHQLVGLENYNVWSRSMRIALLAKNKLGFVDGSCQKEIYGPDLHPQWERCNAIVLSWILNAVSKELSAGIVFASNAASVWDNLRERFDKMLWDEYVALVPIASCECANSHQYSRHVTQQQLLQFLMGLNETYSSIRSQILLMQPLSSVNQAYSMVAQEESQRIQLSAMLSPDSSVFYSKSSGIPDRRRFQGTCDYCKVKGHKRDSCYRLIGFPPDFKFSKRRHAQAVVAVSESVAALEPAVVYDLTNAYGIVDDNLHASNKSSTWILDTGPLKWKDEGDW
ncbi:uncharacterized protein LOC120218908 [Hibiscus syriacus]|uniref:uncharacterized protein LOC120218908 n=1 Tax=Hibiscus syriacus TaxID=106335 RepID=UPI00192146B3|nr:uncharacterized protein LOC120218908 [Hibiscus syriacus]